MQLLQSPNGHQLPRKWFDQEMYEDHGVIGLNMSCSSPSFDAAQSFNSGPSVPIQQDVSLDFCGSSMLMSNPIPRPGFCSTSHQCPHPWRRTRNLSHPMIPLLRLSISHITGTATNIRSTQRRQR